LTTWAERIPAVVVVAMNAMRKRKWRPEEGFMEGAGGRHRS